MGKKQPNEKVVQGKDMHVTAMDGGWGWAVVVGAFVLNFLIGGAIHAFGILYVALLEVFHQSSGKTAWVGSMASSIGLLFGPVFSALSNRFSCRTMVFVGGLFVSSGWVASSFVPSLEYMFLTYGLIAGIGKSLAFTPAMIMLGQWFDKRRSLVNGIAVAGAGFGSFALAPLLATLLHEYKLTGTMRIMGGVMLLICACGVLFRPVPRIEVRVQEIVTNEISTKNKDINLSLQTQMHFEKYNKTNSETTSPGHPRGSEHDALNISNNSEIINKGNTQQKPDFIIESNDQVYETKCHSEAETKFKDCKQREQICQSNEGTEYSNGEIKSINDTENIRKNTHLNLDSNKRKTAKDLFDYTLLKNPIFLSFGFSVMLTTLGHSSPSVMLPPMVEETNVSSEKAAILISVIGIADLIGRIMFGVLCNITFFKKKRTHLYAVSVFLSGALNIMCGFASAYWHFVIYAVTFRLFAGSYNALTPVILVDLLGADKLSSSFGLALLFQGVGYLLGPPIAGWLRDGSGYYQTSFYFAGASMVLSAIVINIPALYHILTQKRKKDESIRIQNFNDNLEFKVENQKAICKFPSISVISETDICKAVPCHDECIIPYVK